jgi:hypothetical protein
MSTNFIVAERRREQYNKTYKDELRVEEEKILMLGRSQPRVTRMQQVLK